MSLNREGADYAYLCPHPKVDPEYTTKVLLCQVIVFYDRESLLLLAAYLLAVPLHCFGCSEKGRKKVEQ
jgi:hypothetical protein